MVSQYYNPVIYKYPGVKKILEYITKTFYFPGIKKRIKDYIAKYTDCNQNKVNRHKPYKIFKTLKILIRAWENII